MSWLDRAERETNDSDAKFVFLWIAFNAAYANRISEESGYSEILRERRFLRRLVRLDSEGLLSDLVWNQFSGPVRLLIENQFVCREFWDCHNGICTETEFRKAFDRSRKRAWKGLASKQTELVLAVVFDRLYVLRNQIIHGGSTWNSIVNRDQILDAVRIMGLLVPILIHLMLEGGFEEWDEGIYPVIST